MLAAERPTLHVILDGFGGYSEADEIGHRDFTEGPGGGDWNANELLVSCISVTFLGASTLPCSPCPTNFLRGR